MEVWMNFPFRRRASLGLLLPALLLEGCIAQPGASAPSSATPPTTAGQQVIIDNFTFSPVTLTVGVGSTVTWVNHDDVPHTVTSPSKPRVLQSPTLDTDDRFTFVFTAPGTYDYYCTVHPKMTGQIIVK
jgi:plastocyanin